MLLAKQSPDFILEIADRLEPEVRRAFLRAVEALKKAIPVNQIADLLDDGRLTEALSSLSDVPLPDLTEIRDAIANAAIRTSESVAVEFGMNFELVNERAVRWAQQHAGNMITNVNRETVKAVRDIIVRGQREGLNVRNQAQLIRSVVGLTDRDARAVDRFYQGLLETVSERQARRQRDIMANRLLRRRAENIARTETIRASNMGTQLGWETAQDQGFLPQSAQKVWIATEDSRTCPICAVLDGEVIGMRDGFNVDRQAVSFTQDGDDFRVAETVPLKRPTIERTPPAHPSCRCTAGLEFASGEGPLLRVSDAEEVWGRDLPLNRWIENDGPDAPWNLNEADFTSNPPPGFNVVSSNQSFWARNTPDEIVINRRSGFFEASSEHRRQIILHEMGHDVDRFMAKTPERFNRLVDLWDDPTGPFRNAVGNTLDHHVDIGEAVADGYMILWEDELRQRVTDLGFERFLGLVLRESKAAGLPVPRGLTINKIRKAVQEWRCDGRSDARRRVGNGAKLRLR